MSDDPATREEGAGPDDRAVPMGALEPHLAQIAAYLSGDEEAFRRVDGWIRREIETRYPYLRPDLDDLCQVVHEKLVPNLRAERFGGRSNLRSYVVGVSNHTAIDRIRRLHRERRALEQWSESPVWAGDEPYRSLAALQEKQQLHVVVQRMPAACRDLWRMVFLEKLSYEDIARRLAIPAGTVKSRTWYCRRKALDLFRSLERRPKGRELER